MSSFTSIEDLHEMLLINWQLFGQSHCGIELVLLWIDTIVSLVSASVNGTAFLSAAAKVSSGTQVKWKLRPTTTAARASGKAWCC